LAVPRIVLALLFLLAAAASVGAASGQRPAVTQAPAAAQTVRVAPASHAATPLCPVPARWRPAFRAAAEDTRLPASLLVAMAYVESRFRHDARSPQGAVGLLQVLPSTAAGLRLDPGRPETNVLAGARFLRQLLDRFRSTDVALAAYNAGPAAVERAGGAPSGETLRYVLDVNARWRATVGCAV
jgi:soluble lytic murein transglycosylase-like protein